MTMFSGLLTWPSDARLKSLVMLVPTPVSVGSGRARTKARTNAELVIFSDGTCVHRMCADATGLNVPRCIELQTLADQLGVRAGFGACAPAPD